MKIGRAPSGLLLGAALISACGLVNANIFDTDIRLQRQDYSHNFGQAQGRLPTVACTAESDPCQLVADQLAAGVNGARAFCDTAQRRCAVEGNIALTYPVNLSQDQAFQSSVGQKAVQFVQKIEFGYVLQNSLNFPLPRIDIYIGPQDARSKDDAGVVLLGQIGPFATGEDIPDTAPRTLSVERGSPAFAQLERSIKSPKTPFVFLLSATPRIEADDPVPAGKIELHLYPKITVGLPR